MALIAGSIPPNTCYGTPQQLLDLFAQYLALPGQNLILEAKKENPTLTNNTTTPAVGTNCTFTVDVAGASLNDVVVVNPSALVDKCVVEGFVSSSNQVTIRVMPIATLSSVIPNRTYFLKVLKYSST
ncbi:MAG: hypothetical protein EBU96_04195 [Actinobacteria bacterium]|nr:hypothetical protein [Actinomycetota bacterium]